MFPQFMAMRAGARVKKNDQGQIERIDILDRRGHRTECILYLYDDNGKIYQSDTQNGFGELVERETVKRNCNLD